MGDIVSLLNGLNLGPILTFLLVALLAALKWIGQGIVARVEGIEREVQRLRDEELEHLQALVQRHTTKIAVVRMKLGMEEDD